MRYSSGASQLALGKLREIHATLKPGNKTYEEIVAPREQVFAGYQAAFSPLNLDKLTSEEFKSFLYFENNHHWSGLYRQGGRACEDMQKLRDSLRLLLDETQPIEERVEEAIGAIPGMGRALATAILLVVYPLQYGVWNKTSEAGLKALGIWPDFPRGESFGKRYSRMNEVLLKLAKDLETDLWTLDALWWSLIPDRQLETATVAEQCESDSDYTEALASVPERFALEKHLEEFLLSNWSLTDLGKDWRIYEEDGEEFAGNQYPTDIGSIDILAKHQRENRWLVIELKRNQSSDSTVGQVLRYMGWIKRNLALPGDAVEGLIIAREADERIRYALEALSGVNLLQYEVQFRLHGVMKGEPEER